MTITTHTGRTATRVIDSVELPAPGSWVIDPGHTDLAFTGRHMKFTKVRGRFQDVAGVIEIAENPNDSRVEVTIGMASVNSGDPTRDKHLRSDEMFDVERYPQATFRSRSVEWNGSEGQVLGELTIHGVTRLVALKVVFEGYVRDPWGAERAIFSASTKVNREDFGLTWNMLLEAGGLLVSREISLDISLESVLQV